MTYIDPAKNSNVFTEVARKNMENNMACSYNHENLKGEAERSQNFYSDGETKTDFPSSKDKSN